MPYWILAEERLSKSKKETKGRGAQTDVSPEYMKTTNYGAICYTIIGNFELSTKLKIKYTYIRELIPVWLLFLAFVRHYGEF